MANFSLTDQYPSIFGQSPDQQNQQNYPSVISPRQAPVAIDTPQTVAPAAIDSANIYPKIDPTLKLNAEYGEAIAARAARAAMGVEGKTTLTRPDIQKSMEDGTEDSTRLQATAQIDQQKMQMAKDRLNQGNVSPEELAEVTKLSQPNSVFEDHYASEYVSHLDWPKNQNAMDVPLYYDMIGVAGKYDYVKQTGSKALGFTEYLRTLKEDSDYQVSSYKVIKNLLVDAASHGLYSDLGMRWNGIIQPGILQGENLEEQGRQLYQLALQDPEAAKNKAFHAYKAMLGVDPVLANRWVSAMMGQSQGDRLGNNLWTLVLGTAPLKAGLKAGMKFSAPSFQRLVNATSDMTRPTPSVVPPAVAAPAVAGNLPESAVAKVKIDNLDKFSVKNNPELEARDRLAGLYDINKERAADDDSRLGREMANRVADISDAGKTKMLALVERGFRVDKTPAASTIDQATRRIQQGLADEHRGMDNAVLNVSAPIYSPTNNVKYFRVVLGTHDGDLFRSPQELLDNAKLNGWIEKGSIVSTPRNDMMLSRYKILLDNYAERMANLEPTFEERVAAMEASSGGPVTSPSIPSKSMALGPRGPINPKVNPPPVNPERTSILAKMELIRQRIQQLPRHTTGFTVGAQALEHDPEISRWEGEGGFTADRVGTGYYIDKLVPLPIDADFTRDGLITTKYSKRGGVQTYGKEAMQGFRKAERESSATTELPPARNWLTGYFKSAVGRGLNPNQRLSISEIRNRDLATVGPSKLLEALNQDHPLRRIPRQDAVPFDRYLNYLQKATNEETGLPGRWDDTVHQMDSWWQTYYNRSPEPETIAAYFHYKNAMTHDLAVRDRIVGQRKQEFGINQHNIKYFSPGGKQEQTGFFEGKRLHELPRDFKWMTVVGRQKMNTRTIRSMFLQHREEITADILEGKAKLIQVADPKSKPLGDLSRERVEYVLAYGNRHEEKGLDVANHVNKKHEGHLTPEWNHFVKQAIVDGDVYEGDNTMLNFQTGAEAKTATKYLEQVRQAFVKYDKALRGDKASLTVQADLEAISRLEGEGGITSDIPHPIHEAIAANRTGIPFWKLYDEFFGKNARLDLHEPFVAVPKDRHIIDLAEEGKALRDRHSRVLNEVLDDGRVIPHQINLLDGTKGQGSLLGKALVEFTGERDAEGIFTLRNKGTQQNPIYAYEPAPYIDPIPAMERSYSRIAKTAYASEYQAMAREHWLQQAIEAGALKTRTSDVVGDIRNNPIHYFEHPQYVDGLEPEVKAQLESNRLQAREFGGMRPYTQTTIRRFGQQIADSIATRYPQKNKVTLMTLNALTKDRDPVGLIRNIAYQPTLGMFNFSQFFTQISSFTNVLFISPRQAAGAAIGTMLYDLTKINRSPEFIAELERKAIGMTSKLPFMTEWRTGWFKEFVDLLDDSGFGRTGSEHAMASNRLGDNIIKKGWGTFLDIGSLPFNIGSNYVKKSAFAAAFLEHRLLDPMGKIGEAEKAKILTRANLLDMNMSSAYSTKLHTGVWGIPMQFQAYNLRLVENFYGGNLTGPEKARMLLGSMMMYGVLGGSGIATLYPLADFVSGRIMDAAGYQPGEHPIYDLFAHGAISVLLKYISGLGDYQNGTMYDTSRWGNKGVDPFQKILEDDASLLSIAGGPAGDLLANSVNNLYSLGQFFKYKVSGGDMDFPISSSEIMDNIKSIQFASNTYRLWYALHYGKLISKNESEKGDVSGAEAWTQYITGLAPQWSTELYRKQHDYKVAEEHIRETQRQYSLEIQRAVRSDQDNNNDEAQVHYKRAYIFLQAIPPNMWQETWKKAYEHLAQDERTRVNYDYYIKLQNDIDKFSRAQQAH